MLLEADGAQCLDVDALLHDLGTYLLTRTPKLQESLVELVDVVPVRHLFQPDDICSPFTAILCAKCGFQLAQIPLGPARLPL